MGCAVLISMCYFYCCWIQEPLDESEAIAAVHEAFKLGINFFDTSPYYGETRSEKVVLDELMLLTWLLFRSQAHKAAQ